MSPLRPKSALFFSKLLLAEKHKYCILLDKELEKHFFLVFYVILIGIPKIYWECHFSQFTT
jgi:hypothetical protein